MDIERSTLVLEQERDDWIGHAPEVPGAYAQGTTLEEVCKNLSEAVYLALQAERAVKGVLALPRR